MKTEIIYILDRSGSMGSIWNDAFNGLNSFIEEQKKIDGECKFSLVLFDDKYETPVEAQDLQGVKPIDSKIAYPRGMTALLDAIGKTVNSVGARLDATQDKPDKVLVVIMTDGYENASHEYTKEQIQTMIKHQENKYSWEFIFVGAGIDAVGEGAALGMKAVNTANFDKSTRGVGGMSVYATQTVASYRSGK